MLGKTISDTSLRIMDRLRDQSGPDSNIKNCELVCTESWSFICATTAGAVAAAAMPASGATQLASSAASLAADRPCRYVVGRVCERICNLDTGNTPPC